MAARHVGEIMIPLSKYPHIPHWHSLRQAVAKLEESVVESDDRSAPPRALLVFDEEYRLEGIVRRRDVLRGLEPNFLHHLSIHSERSPLDMDVDPNLAEVSSESLFKAMQKQAEIPVSEVMQPIEVSVDIDDHLIKVIHIMIENDLNLVPVLKDKKVVGAVRSIDVFSEIAAMLLPSDTGSQ